MGTIVRRTAIRLGMRQRRELDKRARWALEQPVVAEPVDGATEAAGTAETLRLALADLPDVHRECLVLFYLEGKSGAEAAAALGISETALRVRLHRARSALRERMEERLAESLEQLRPSRSLVPSVMGVVLSSSSVKLGGSAGFGATLATAMGKVLPYKFAALFTPVIWIIPGLGLGWWMNVLERRNYRDAQGFRVQLHRIYFKGLLFFMGLFLLLNYSVIHWVTGQFGLDALLRVLGVFSLVAAGYASQLLWLNPSRYQKAVVGSQVANGVMMLLVGFHLLPLVAFCALMFFTSFLIIWANGWRPLRMDYNLFLRATQHMIAEPVPAAVNQPPPGPVRLREFAAFLGQRWLAANYRWMDEGLQLCLPAVKSANVARQQSILFRRWTKYSWIRLDWDGTVRAHCAPGDEKALVALGGPGLVAIPELETRVSTATAQAWLAFRRGDPAEAERLLGQVPDADVFIVPTGRARATLRLKYLMIMLVVVFVAEGAYAYYRSHRAPPIPRPHPVLAAPATPAA
jgi:hypothetical protein